MRVTYLKDQAQLQLFHTYMICQVKYGNHAKPYLYKIDFTVHITTMKQMILTNDEVLLINYFLIERNNTTTYPNWRCILNQVTK